MRAANEALAEVDPKRHDIEELSDPEGQHIEMVRRAEHPAQAPPPRPPPALSCPPCTAQNLACGVLEGRPTEPEPAPSDEPMEELRLPSRQTPAVAEAARAGRKLVSEVDPATETSSPAAAATMDVEAESPGTRSRKRRAGAE